MCSLRRLLLDGGASFATDSALIVRMATAAGGATHAGTYLASEFGCSSVDLCHVVCGTTCVVVAGRDDVGGVRALL